MAGLRARLAPLLAMLPEKALAFDIGILFSGFGLQLLTQIGWLILALRFLGPDGYGLFASLTAVTVSVAAFVGLGADQLLIRGVAAERDALPRWLGFSLLLILLTGLPLLLLLEAALPFLEIGRIGFLPLVAVLVADLLLGRVATLCAAVYVATGQAARQSSMTVMTGSARLLAIAIAGLLPGTLSMAAWTAWYAGASLAGAIACLGLVIRDHGWPRFVWIPGQLKDGAAFGAEAALQASVGDLDKPIVLEFAGATQAGLYAAAFRIIGISYLPIRALGYALYGRLFRLAAEDRRAAIAYGVKLLPVGAGIGFVAALGVLVGSGLLPFIFGGAYEELPALLRLICLLPAAFAIYIVGADVLSAIGRQTERLAMVGVSLAATFGLVWLALPIAGIEGAAIARLLVTIATAALVWALVLRRR
ncbi:oligosaccharide flippase family protein [Roseomonas sp. USHLN139]|uniref:oligosaccharide flippase family protein n=1 Tax=Roseomonas sp. USHLN139 TaxID=3081298 RepID=UPI003B014A73